MFELFSIANGYNFKYLKILYRVNKIMSQLQSPSSLTLLPPHIENVAKTMVATLTPVARKTPPQLAVQLARLAYVDDEA
jgi:hypothetical protein